MKSLWLFSQCGDEIYDPLFTTEINSKPQETLRQCVERTLQNQKEQHKKISAGFFFNEGRDLNGLFDRIKKHSDTLNQATQNLDVKMKN